MSMVEMSGFTFTGLMEQFEARPDLDCRTMRREYAQKTWQDVKWGYLVKAVFGLFLAALSIAVIGGVWGFGGENLQPLLIICGSFAAASLIGFTAFLICLYQQHKADTEELSKEKYHAILDRQLTKSRERAEQSEQFAAQTPKKAAKAPIRAIQYESVKTFIQDLKEKADLAQFRRSRPFLPSGKQH